MQQLDSHISGEGKPIILLHGLFGSSDNWRQVAKKLSQNFCVHVLDLRNHGNSFHSPKFDYRVMALDVEQYSDIKKLHSPILIGHSLGGKVAMQCAANQPKAYAKIVIVDIAHQAYQVEHHKRILTGLRQIPLATLKSRSQADVVLADYESDVVTRQFILKNLVRNRETRRFEWKIPLDYIFNNLHCIAEPPNVKGRVSDVPAILIKGGRSSYVSRDGFEATKEILSNIQLLTIDEAGHLPHVETPEVFYELLKEFLLTDKSDG